MSVFTSPLASQLDRFLKYKHSLGYRYLNEEVLLCYLDRAAIDSGLEEPVIDEAFFRQFVSQASIGSRMHRLTLARQLSRFVAMEEPRTFVPPRSYLGIRRQQPVIRVLSREEARRFLDACDTLTGTLTGKRSTRGRWLIHGTVLWTLLLTGLRRGEALGLTDEDVDLFTGVLTIRRSKFGKSRFVPIAQDVTERLKTYREKINLRFRARRQGDVFFPGPDGRRPCCPRYLYDSFRHALDVAGISHHGRGHGPRIHDLRHTFAVLRLLSWYEEGADLQVKLPLLATYLGHIGMKTTQVYLHMTKDLVGEVIRYQKRRFGDIITAEVPT